MKTLKFIVMAMFAVALSMSFTACSSSDGDDDGGQENQENQGNQGNQENNGGQENQDKNNIKYIETQKSQQTYQGYLFNSTFDISYDGKRLKEINGSTNYSYCPNTGTHWIFDYDKCIISYSGRGPYPNQTCSFAIGNNGCITKISSSEACTTFTYNENRQLMKYETTYSDNTEDYTYFIWENGNLVGIEKSTYMWTLEYNNIVNKGNIQPLYNFLSIWLFKQYPQIQTSAGGPYSIPSYDYPPIDVTNIIMSSGLFGVSSKELPSKAIYTYKGEYGHTRNFTYELDEMGFVKTINSDYSYGFVSSSFTYKN